MNMLRSFSFDLFPLIFLAIPGLLIFDIFYTGKYAPTNSKVFWLLVVVFGPFVVPFFGILIWIVYPFVGHKALLRESVEALESEHNQSRLQPPANTFSEQVDSTPVTISENFKPSVSPTQTVGFYTPETIEKFKNTTSIIGGILSVIMILAGMALLGFMILIAIVMYQCSRPGAKCM